MDLLTLRSLAAHAPATIILDTDGDYWHARCLSEWLGEEPPSTYTLLRGGRTAVVVADADRACYHCVKGETWTS